MEVFAPYIFHVARPAPERLQKHENRSETLFDKLSDPAVHIRGLSSQLLILYRVNN